MKKSPSSRTVLRYVLLAIFLVFVIAGIKIASVYKQIYVSNIETPEKKPLFIYIPTGSAYADVVAILDSNHLIENRKTFEWAAEKKKYPEHIHPGRYRVTHSMSNNELINMLRSGLQEPVDVVINLARTPEELAEKLDRQIEAGRDELLALMRNEDFLKTYGFNSQTVIGMFIPNTYEFWWNTDPEGFFKRMNKEYEKFWNHERTARAEEIRLTRNEVVTLASIIMYETNKEDEYNRMAGVYINRMNQGMRLQACPTIVFALGDFSRQRILKTDTYIDSPYNTYLHDGLPPGPIGIPSIKAIDAVLRYERHDYLYFAAKEDFSGYHNFARTLDQHNKNARSYQKVLNRRNILK